MVSARMPLAFWNIVFIINARAQRGLCKNAALLFEHRLHNIGSYAAWSLRECQLRVEISSSLCRLVRGVVSARMPIAC